jgi:lipopolysaccharide biosynthesis glycosyltransferase
MRNAIVTAADANYLPAACCALISCVRDGEAGYLAKLFLLAHDVPGEDLQEAERFLRYHGTSAEIIPLDVDRFRRFRIDGYVSASTYTRLLLADVFDDRWDRLLYVDSDMRVTMPLRGLFEANLRERPIGAVHDYMRYLIYGLKHSRERLGLQPDAPYFNAGLVCFDWRATIASGLLQKATAFAIENPNLCESHDQDALNKAFEGSWTPLDPRWNFMVVAVPDHVLRLYYPERLRPYVAHFAGSVKPWMTDFPARYEDHRAWYQELLRESPWPEFTARASIRTMANPARSTQVRLRALLSKQRGRLKAAMDRLLHGSAMGPGYHNTKLAALLDDMIEEAANLTDRFELRRKRTS